MEYEPAISEFSKLIKEIEKENDPYNNKELLRSLSNIGECKVRLGNIKDAIPYYERAEKLAIHMYGEKVLTWRIFTSKWASSTMSYFRLTNLSIII
ncbi:MAG: tetratricopeptide repeat protein [Saprospiraceae bacterium]